jgi:hypothetical protein
VAQAEIEFDRKNPAGARGTNRCAWSVSVVVAPPETRELGNIRAQTGGTLWQEID